MIGRFEQKRRRDRVSRRSPPEGLVDDASACRFGGALVDVPVVTPAIFPNSDDESRLERAHSVLCCDTNGRDVVRDQRPATFLSGIRTYNAKAFLQKRAETERSRQSACNCCARERLFSVQRFSVIVVSHVLLNKSLLNLRWPYSCPARPRAA